MLNPNSYTLCKLQGPLSEERTPLIAQNSLGLLIDFETSKSVVCIHEWILMREETGVPGENPEVPPSSQGFYDDRTSEACVNKKGHGKRLF